MVKGKDTMVRENSREEVTVSDGLQLGRTTVDPTEIKSAEDEVDTLKHQVEEVGVYLLKTLCHCRSIYCGHYTLEGLWINQMHDLATCHSLRHCVEKRRKDKL